MKNAETITTYERLHYFIRGFTEGYYNMLILIGERGLGKSKTVENYLADNGGRILDGGSTPYALYMELWEHRDCPIILDDCDRMWKQKSGQFLLKILCQNTAEKRVQWNARTAEITEGILPKQFTTTSRVVIVANSWEQGDADIRAVESRGTLLHFQPTIPETHNYVANWFLKGNYLKDVPVFALLGEGIIHREAKLVYQFAEDKLPLLAECDVRMYDEALRAKLHGIAEGDLESWKEKILKHCVDREQALVLRLLKDASYESNRQRALAWVKITGSVEKTGRKFYRIYEELKPRLEWTMAAKEKPA